MTGVISLNNTNVLADYDFSIVVRNRGGSDGSSESASFNPTLRIDNIRLSVVCGIGSTKISAPTLIDIT
jgi:hypothetical protein